MPVLYVRKILGKFQENSARKVCLWDGTGQAGAESCQLSKKFIFYAKNDGKPLKDFMKDVLCSDLWFRKIM